MAAFRSGVEVVCVRRSEPGLWLRISGSARLLSSSPPLQAQGLMDVQALVHSRHSVRGFRNEAVPKAVIREIMEDAKRAPSSINSQPWHVHVFTGEPLEEVHLRNMEEMAAGKPLKRDIFTHGPSEGAHRTRRQGDAPVSLILTYDRIGPHPVPDRHERHAEPNEITSREYGIAQPSPRGGCEAAPAHSHAPYSKGGRPHSVCCPSFETHRFGAFTCPCRGAPQDEVGLSQRDRL